MKRRSKTIEEWRAEAAYIQDTYINGANDWRTLTNFNQDYDCFNRYVEMQADAAEADGFPGIAEDMRKHRL